MAVRLSGLLWENKQKTAKSPPFEAFLCTMVKAAGYPAACMPFLIQFTDKKYENFMIVFSHV